MDRTEALSLEREVRYALTSHKHKEAVDLAFAALREQEQGEQGCEFCNAVCVVRCKDCRESCCVNGVFGQTLFCNYWGKNTDENGYCHEGCN